MHFSIKNIGLLLLLIVFSKIVYSQKRSDRYKDIEKYIPYNLASYKRFPIKTVNVKVHVIQFSKEKPMNLTVKDSAKIARSINNQVNYTYANLEPPTLKPNKHVAEIRDSRIRFNVVDVLYHIDPELISSEILEESDKYGSPWKVDSINLETNEIIFERYNANHFKKKPRGMDSIAVYSSTGSRYTLNFDTVTYLRPYTKIKIKQKLTNFDIVKVANFKKHSKVCDPDLYEKYAAPDSSHLHIFITNSFYGTAMGGCGPSPLYMKVGNWNFGDGPGTVAHEAGHCLGLYHTNTPQFDDLPIKDKLCSTCNCDSTTVSNNIMGYNFCKNYLSPKQIGFMYKEYSTQPIKIKTTTDCIYDQKRTLKINKNFEYKRAIAYGGDIVIKKKKQLIILDKLSLPKGAHVFIEKKAKLIIDGGLIYNACGENWEGIKFVKKYKSNEKKIKEMDFDQERFILKNGGEVENLDN